MIEKIMKAVKSSNKKRSRNITIGTVIGFLLSCTAVMGAGDYLWIKEDNGKIKFSTDSTTDSAEGTWNERNPYENAGNIWDKDTKTYTNNTLLSSNAANGKNSSGRNISYGLRLSGELTDVNFINNSSIKGEMSGVAYNYSYGIYNESTKMGNIENMGVISGYGTSSSGYGNGIENYKGTIGDITNTGVISGYCSSSYGYGNGYGIENDEGTIGDITNTGVISGYGNGLSSGSGYGITNYSLESLAQMGNITNAGLINGSGSGSSTGSGRGINNTHTMENITNTGIISGTGKLDSSGKSYGIYSVDKIGNIINTGIISGTSKHDGNYESCGIYNFGKMGNIENTGVIYGTDNAIKNEGSKTIDTVNNYGILVNGKDQDVNAGTITNMNNYGLTIKNEGKGTITAGTQDITIEYDKDGKVIKSRSMTIKNANIEGGSGTGTSTESIELGNNNYDNYILNGKDKTLKVTGSNDKITGSIINAYGTAVVFGDTGDKELTLSGTIVNGGIEDSTNGIAISGSSNGDNLILQSGEIEYKINEEKKYATQNTVVNGNIDMKDGDDTLTIGDGTIINGTLDGGDGDDTLNFGMSSVAKSNPAEREGVRILYNISSFEKMNINTNVTLFEKTINASGEVADLKVTGAAEVKIGENGTLTLRIDSTNKDNSSGIDKIIGHALYENEGELSSTDGGKLLLALNGAGNESIISFGKTTLGDGLVTGNEGTLDTTSQLHTILKLSENEVKVVIRWDIPEILKYKELNKIYHGILSVDDLIANFNVDSDEKLSTFLGYLNDIYAGNPYSYSSELSRKSVGMFRGIAVESQFKPELNKWLIMGGLTHVDGGTKDTYYGKGYYTYDIGSSDMDADTKITGAYMLGEYGVSDTLAYGVVIGGNKLKSELSNGSKVDGDALYMGAYAKKYVGNLKVTGGLGLQYGDYDADRIAAGKGITETRSYSDNYNDMTYDIYLNGRYSHNIGNNLFLEPYGTLSYTYVDQEGADEGSKVLAIETDSKTFDYTAAKVGLDIKKVIPHEKGKSTLSAGVSYIRLLTGADEENITGRFKGGSDFDILVAHKNKHSIGLNAKYALELESGILFDVKGSYSVERDSHNESGKNRAKGEWIVGAGLGYRF
ncbi:autotransporter outer membrane beta-barrel domain-containing protein [Fusobacterium varium]|uniref:autotransporter family protein n=1 Tax=Fusobacterium varium TaxID=856 RepID=UPI002FEE9919